MKRYVILMLLVLLGCNTEGPSKIIEIGNPIEVYFCPRDNCEEQLINKINSARVSVHCAFFDLDLVNLINALNEATDAKLVLDSDNYDKQTRSIPTVLDDRSQLTHNKFCIIDDKIVTTGSFNPTVNGNTKNNNNLVIVSSRYLAENYEEEFQELWNFIFGEGKKVKNPVIEYNLNEIENYFCPEDNCAQHLIHEILNAKESVYFMTFAFTDEDVADALLMIDVEVKGIFEKLQAAQSYSQFKRLKEFGLDVYIDNNPKNMHHKVFIIDKKTVITGSYNPTSAGNRKNDENMLIIHSERIASHFLEEFEYLLI